MGDFGGMSLAWAFQEWRDWHQERPLGTFSRMKRVSLGLLIEAFKKTGRCKCDGEKLYLE